MSFDTFIAELSRTEHAGAWHFAPGVVHMIDGEAVQARNTGGEIHTFTEVEEFGGGIIPVLNLLSGNPEPARECDPTTINFVLRVASLILKWKNRACIIISVLFTRGCAPTSSSADATRLPRDVTRRLTKLPIHNGH